MKYSRLFIIGCILASLGSSTILASTQGLYSTATDTGASIVYVPNKSALDSALKKISDLRMSMSKNDFRAYLDRLMSKIRTLKQKYASTSSTYAQLQYLESGIQKLLDNYQEGGDDDDLICQLGLCDDDDTKKDGICGSANGATFSSVPSTNLCSQGNATRVSGNGPRYWSCVGTGGGYTASCSATPSTYSNNGSCGSAHGVSTNTQPTSGLCSVGSASGVSGSGPWYWTCYGVNGGTNASCSAPYTGTNQYARCGSSNGQTFSYKPTSGLCEYGSASSVSGSGPWYWTCYGNNDTYVNCQAYYNSTNHEARCGYSNGKTFTSKPNSGLCDSGYASSVSGSGPWYWTCSGNNGSQVSCSAYYDNQNDFGKCGSAHLQTFTLKPSSNLCEKGTASRVSGNGPWYWNCVGNNGRSESCYAYYREDTQDAMCGYSNGKTFSSIPTSGLCEIGTSSSVTGTGPWYWTCTTRNSRGDQTVASCSAYASITYGKCGSANGKVSTSKPTSGLCESGSASEVTGSGPWYWSCVGSNGASESCSASTGDILRKNGECGSAHGQIYSSKPTANLCSVGVASSVTGDGPWFWTCEGLEGGKNAYCSAQSNSESQRPQCGPANGKAFPFMPTQGLCDRGNASPVIDDRGERRWNCRDSKGMMAHCRAQKIMCTHHWKRDDAQTSESYICQ